MKNYYNKTVLNSVVALTLISLLSAPIFANAEEGLGLGLNSNARSDIGVKISLQDKAEKENNNSGKGESEKAKKIGADVRASTTISSSSTINLNDDRLPPGIQKAPGIEKRIENGKGLPSGLLKFFQNLFSRFTHKGNATSTVDVALPNIEDLHVVNGTSTVSVVWKTNENTTGEVRYSTSSPVTASSSLVADSSLKENHSVVLSGLTPDTKYYYLVVAKDSSGNVKTSEEKNFTTRVIDVVAPNIMFNTVFDVKGSSAQVAWVTSERSDSRVWVSTVNPVSTSGTSTASSTDLVRFHDIGISGLATSTQYYYAIQSTDASGNASTVSVGSFTTLAN